MIMGILIIRILESHKLVVLKKREYFIMMRFHVNFFNVNGEFDYEIFIELYL